MTLVATPYHNLACNGRIDNLVNPSCPAVSPGSWDAEKAEQTALERGWRRHGKGGHLCPACGALQDEKEAPSAEAEAAPARRRGRGKAAAANDTAAWDPSAVEEPARDE